MMFNLCQKCMNYKDGTTSCRAFKRIPDEIWFGLVEHKKPYKGDNGIQFEPIVKEEEKKRDK